MDVERKEIETEAHLRIMAEKELVGNRRLAADLPLQQGAGGRSASD
jgi:hypothetical protein